MKKLGLIIAALGAIAIAAPSIASAETIVIKRGGHHHGYGARAEFREHRDHGEARHRNGPARGHFSLFQILPSGQVRELVSCSVEGHHHELRPFTMSNARHVLTHHWSHASFHSMRMAGRF